MFFQDLVSLNNHILVFSSKYHQHISEQSLKIIIMIELAVSFGIYMFLKVLVIIKFGCLL